MKRKKAIGKQENVIYFRKLMDKKRMNDMCSLDYEELKLSAASCAESSILKEHYCSLFARLPRSKLQGMRLLPNSSLPLPN